MNKILIASVFAGLAAAAPALAQTYDDPQADGNAKRYTVDKYDDGTRFIRGNGHHGYFTNRTGPLGPFGSKRIEIADRQWCFGCHRGQSQYAGDRHPCRRACRLQSHCGHDGQGKETRNSHYR